MSDLSSVDAESFYGIKPEVTAEQSRAAAQAARQNAADKNAPEFESCDNTEFIKENEERMKGPEDARPKELEKLSQSEREAWLKDGTLPEAKKKEKETPRQATEETGSAGDTDAGRQLPTLTDLDREYTEAGEMKAWSEPAHQQALASLGERLTQDMPKLANYDAVQTALKTRDVRWPKPLYNFLQNTLAESNNPAATFAELALHPDFALTVVNDYHLAGTNKWERLPVLSAFRETLLAMGKNGKGSEGPARPRVKTVTDALPPPREVGGKGTGTVDEEEAALKNDDFTRYQKAANDREAAKWRANHVQRSRR